MSEIPIDEQSLESAQDPRSIDEFVREARNPGLVNGCRELFVSPAWDEKIISVAVLENGRLLIVTDRRVVEWREK